MSQPQPFHYDNASQRWYHRIYNPATRVWDSEWMPQGWSPVPTAPITPEHSRTLPIRPSNNGYGATGSPASPSPAGAAFGQPVGTFSPPYPGQQPIQYLPRGRGTRIKGSYNGPGTLHYEPVDTSFFVRNGAFFAEGRVLAMVVTEAAGDTRRHTDYNSAWSNDRNISTVKYTDHEVFTQTRRFVVVRQKREFCFACPIFTYSGRATTKPGAKPGEHSIAYSWGHEPQLIPGEFGITKASIGVVMADKDSPLHIASRIYFGIHHPIQYNVKVKDIGFVHRDHLHSLIGNWNEENKKDAPIERPDSSDESDEDKDDSPSDEAEDLDVKGKKSQKAKAKSKAKTKPKASKGASTKPDPFSYDLQKNPHGFDANFNPHVYHPDHNPHGYHPNHNKFGYHPSSNPHMYHPQHNVWGYHPKHKPKYFHPVHNPHTFHPTNNQNGYSSKSNEHAYHPERNKHGYHPETHLHMYHPTHNPRGYHPEKSPHSYHPKKNPFGYHYESAQYCYHPHFSPHGYHSTANPAGYHPITMPYNYHPQGNPYGYHAIHNPTAYHPDYNPSGYQQPYDHQSQSQENPAPAYGQDTNDDDDGDGDGNAPDNSDLYED